MPGNVAVAVHPDVEYVTVERQHNGGTREADPGQEPGASDLQGRAGQGTGYVQGAEAEGMEVSTAFHVHASGQARAFRGPGRFRHDRGRLGPRAHGTGLRRRGHGDGNPQ